MVIYNRPASWVSATPKSNAATEIPELLAKLLGLPCSVLAGPGKLPLRLSQLGLKLSCGLLLFLAVGLSDRGPLLGLGKLRLEAVESFRLSRCQRLGAFGGPCRLV